MVYGAPTETCTVASSTLFSSSIYLSLNPTHVYTVPQGKPEIAVPFCKKAVLELKQKKGSEDPDVAAMLNILAVIYRYANCML